MRVVLIGSGNTATVLGRMVIEGKHELLQVFSRNSSHAGSLAQKLVCEYTTNPAQIRRDADLYIVAIADKALSGIDSWLQLERKMVVHTAGSVSKDVLSNVSANYGILYPLQSLRKELEEIPDVPLLVDANSAESLALMKDFAFSISPKVYKAGDRERESIHLAAVIVSNFTNHLYTLAADFCMRENLDFKMLQPLIEEVAGRLKYSAPQEVQTGPAIRNDQVTIEKHVKALSSSSDLKKIYALFTEEILRYYSK